MKHANTGIMHLQATNWQNSKFPRLYGKFWLWLIGCGLVYCVSVNERENLISGENVSEQYLLLCKHKKCIMHKWKRRTKKSWKFCQTKSRFLCMHKILVHAQHSCACTTLLCMHWRGQGPRPGPKKSAVGRARDQGPSSACTRVLCMHKSGVHAQESCACTRTLTNKPLW